MSRRAGVIGLRVGALLVLVGGLAMIGLGVWWVSDLPQDPGPLDGVVLLLAGTAGGIGVAQVVPAVVVLALARRRTHAAALVLGVLGTGTALVAWSTGHLFPDLVTAPAVLGGLAVGALGFLVSLDLAHVTIDSPDGISR